MRARETGGWEIFVQQKKTIMPALLLFASMAAAFAGDALKPTNEAVISEFYCLYLTSYNPLDKSAGENRDLNYEVLKSELVKYCNWKENKIYYMPKQSASRQSVSITLDHLLKMDNNPAVANHLMIVMDGFSADDSTIYLVSSKNKSDGLTFRTLHNKISRHPIRSVFFLMNLRAEQYQAQRIDSIANKLIDHSRSYSQSAFIILSDSANFSQQSAGYFQAFAEGLEAGADENGDFSVGTQEMEAYFKAQFETPQPPINLAWRTVASQTDDFTFRGYPKPIDTFNLETLEGTNYLVSADSARTKPLVMIFGATYCLPCDAEKSDLRALHAASKKSFDVVYLSLDMPDKLELAKSKAKGYPFIFLFDPGKTIFSKYALHGALPLTLIIDKQNQIVYKKHGYNKKIDQKNHARLLEMFIK